MRKYVNSNLWDDIPYNMDNNITTFRVCSNTISDRMSTLSGWLRFQLDIEDLITDKWTHYCGCIILSNQQDYDMVRLIYG